MQEHAKLSRVGPAGGQVSEVEEAACDRLIPLGRHQVQLVKLCECPRAYQPTALSPGKCQRGLFANSGDGV